MQLPSSYDIGDGYVNLMMAVLRQARSDYGTEYDDGFWAEFMETKTYQRGVRGVADPFHIALGMASYIGG